MPSNIVQLHWSANNHHLFYESISNQAEICACLQNEMFFQMSVDLISVGVAINKKGRTTFATFKFKLNACRRVLAATSNSCAVVA